MGILSSNLLNQMYNDKNLDQFQSDFTEFLVDFNNQTVGQKKSDLLIQILSDLQPKIIESIVSSVTKRIEIEN